MTMYMLRVKISLKILMGLSETVNQRIDNKMDKRKRKNYDIQNTTKKP